MGLMKTFDFLMLEDAELECGECGWMGKGYETEKNFSSLPEAIDVCCPVCGCFLGEIKKELVRKPDPSSY
ncbi:MAG: hypothetical protein ACXVBR_16435 [Flavisolibacter sp.]